MRQAVQSFAHVGRRRQLALLGLGLGLCAVARCVAAFSGGHLTGGSPLAAGRPPRGRALRADAAAVDPADCAAVKGNALSGVLLPPKSDDDEAWLTDMIRQYLDEEWLEQPIHLRIGEATSKLYGQSRAEGQNDLVGVLAEMSYGLKDMWKAEGFDESFEGPVDIANRAAEFLMLRIGKEVWSYGASNSEVQEKLIAKLARFEESGSAAGSP
mmetsp:Transcript_62858/g.159585  ORF Transcript_62858/g.159585 Transcript_62858/m.159585 type:complete len:212 (+) Transcript_62858:83-718(+)